MLSYRLNELANRASDSEHPKGWLCTWTDECVSTVREAASEIDDLRRFIEARGYRRCDIAACNCGSYHGGHASQRLTEIEEALREADIDLNGRTILNGVNLVLARLRDYGGGSD